MRNALSWRTPKHLHRNSGLALFLLLTAAASWLWAHAGHAPLPTRGAQVDLDKGTITLSGEARDALDVGTAEVNPRSLNNEVLGYATLAAPWQGKAYVTSGLPGRIVKLKVQAGEAVESGQVLAELESLELKTLLLELRNTGNDEALSGRLLRELEATRRDGAVTEQALEEARARNRQDQNAVEIVRMKWANLGFSPEELAPMLRERNPNAPVLTIRSPIRGVLTHADLAVGKIVDPADHLFEIVNLDTVWARIGILEKDLRPIKEGQAVELTLAAYPGEVFRGPVAMVGADLDPDTHLGNAWLKLSNPPKATPRLLPGMYGQARILVPAAEKGLVIPVESLLRGGAERFVLVEESNTAAASDYRKQNVVVLAQTGGWVTIRAGALFPGDRVVTRGAHELGRDFKPGVLRLSPEASAGIDLAVEPVALRVVEEVIELDGEVEVPPERRATVSTPLPGTLEKVLVIPGQVVQRGDIVAEVASLELQNLQLDLLRAHLDAALRRDSLRRLEAVKGAVPRPQVLETEAQYRAAVNRGEVLRQKLESVGLTSAQVEALLTTRRPLPALPVRAPFAGKVARLDKVLGQVLKAEDPFLEVQDTSQVWLTGHVREGDLSRVQVGQRARFELVADPTFGGEGTVVRSGRVFEGDSRTLTIWVKPDGVPAAALRHNLLARMILTVTRHAPSPAVPQAAVVREGTRAYVFVRSPDGTFARQAVTLGRTDDRWVEVASGLEVGQPIAVRGAGELQTAYAGLR